MFWVKESIKMEIRELAESIFTENPTRFNKKEKTALLEKAKSFLSEKGWGKDEMRVQSFKGTFHSRNLIIGDPSKAEYLITAHYDTAGRNGFMLASSKLLGQTGANILLMAIMLPLCLLAGIMEGRAMAAGRYLISLGCFLLLMGICAVSILSMFIKNPSNRNDNTSGVIAVLSAAAKTAANPQLKEKYCFILFDNEEWGMVGSSQFAKWCKKERISLTDKTNINIDCVGVGEQLYAARTNAQKTERQESIIKRMNDCGLNIKEKQSSLVYMSDHANLKNSFMLCYMARSAVGAPYIPNIHRAKDKVCDVEKVLDLSEKMLMAVAAEE